MPRNGSGTFNRLYSWEDDAANNIKIRADRMDAEMDGMATALTNSVAVDGQTPITANLPMSGFKHTGVADATEDDEYVAFGQANDLYQGFAPFTAIDGGTDAYEFDAGRDVADGDVIIVAIPASNSTATPTGENTGGTPTGAQNIITSVGSAYIGMLEARAHRFQWDAGNTSWVVLDPAGGATGFVKSPLMFGAKGDGDGEGGGTDDTSAINNAIASLPTGGVLDGLGKTYLVTGDVNGAIFLQSDMTLRNITLDFSTADNDGRMLYVSGTMETAVNITSSISAGDATIDVADSSGFSVDDYVFIDSTELWDDGDDDATVGEVHQVKEVATGTLTFYDPCLYSMTDGLTVAKISTVKNINLENVTGIGNSGGAATSQFGAELRMVLNLRVRDCKFSDFEGRGFWIWRCINPYFNGCDIGNSNATGTSYGIQFASATYYSKVIGCHFWNQRHGVDYGDVNGVNRYGIIEGNTFAGMREAGMSTHTAADHIIISNNHLECDPNGSSGGGIIIRSINTQILGNRIINPGSHAINIFDTPEAANGTVEVIGNEVRGLRGGNAGVYIRTPAPGRVLSATVANNTILANGAASSTGIWVRASSASVSKLVVTGNVVDDVDTGIFIFTDSATPVIENVVVANNSINIITSGGEAVYLNASTDGNIQNISVMGNVASGDFSYGFRGIGEEDLIIVGNSFIGGSISSITSSATNTAIANNLT